MKSKASSPFNRNPSGRLLQQPIQHLQFNPFLYNVEKWPKMFQKSSGVLIAGFLKYVGHFQKLCMKGLKLDIINI